MVSGKSLLPGIFIVFALVVLTAAAAFAQTTAFTYQGRLTAAGMPPDLKIQRASIRFSVSGRAAIS